MNPIDVMASMKMEDGPILLATGALLSNGDDVPPINMAWNPEMPPTAIVGYINYEAPEPATEMVLKIEGNGGCAELFFVMEAAKKLLALLQAMVDDWERTRDDRLARGPALPRRPDKPARRVPDGPWLLPDEEPFHP
jgi:hypothetical protein